MKGAARGDTTDVKRKAVMTPSAVKSRAAMGVNSRKAMAPSAVKSKAAMGVNSRKAMAPSAVKSKAAMGVNSRMTTAPGASSTKVMGEEEIFHKAESKSSLLQSLNSSDPNSTAMGAVEAMGEMTTT